MKKIGLVTDIDFWRIGAGARSRSLQLIEYISGHITLTVFYTGKREVSDVSLVKRLNLKIHLIWLDECGSLDKSARVYKLAKLLKQCECDAVIFRSFGCAYLLDSVPDKGRTFIDIDDMQCDIAESSIEKVELKAGSQGMTFDEEVKVYGNFDRLILIQNEHLKRFETIFPKSKLILASHPVPLIPNILRRKAGIVGYAASGFHANTDGLQWLLQRAWPDVKSSQLNLDIHGYICSRIGSIPYENVRVMGDYKKNENIFRSMDVGVNPVRYGSGIKVKTLEMMGAMVPLVSTTEGVRGLDCSSGQAFVVADCAKGFAAAIDNLAEDFDLRRSLALNAFSYIKDNHSPDICFAPLLQNLLDS